MPKSFVQTAAYNFRNDILDDSNHPYMHSNEPGACRATEHFLDECFLSVCFLFSSIICIFRHELISFPHNCHINLPILFYKIYLQISEFGVTTTFNTNILAEYSHNILFIVESFCHFRWFSLSNSIAMM